MKKEELAHVKNSMTKIYRHTKSKSWTMIHGYDMIAQISPNTSIHVAQKIIEKFIREMDE
jgi:uncharacterized protein YutE (UPF0331/DUF86 family)